jgi:integrase
MKNRKEFNQQKSVTDTVNEAIQSTTPILKPGTPENTRVAWAANPKGTVGYEFAKHYGQGFDAITSAAQQTCDIMLEENLVEVSTVSDYSSSGFKKFAGYLSIYRKALSRDIELSDINIELIENYIQHLKRAHPNGGTAKGYYTHLKSILIKMQSMAWLERFNFPINPFPNSNRKSKGQHAFSKAERRRVAHALKRDVNLLLKKTEPLTGYELTVCLLAIALRSGMNTTPLLEMTVDSIKEHPLKDNRKLLVLYKRRGNATHIQSLRHTQNVENVQTVLADVAVIVAHIIKVNRPLREEMGSDLVFAYRATSSSTAGQVVALNKGVLGPNIKKWVKTHELKNDNGEPLKVNVSRFRKTFENRIWELSGGDPFVTAALCNHTIKVSQTHYLEAPKEAEKSFNFMGKVRTQELINVVELVENNTPVSKCGKPPKTNKDGNNTYCTDFISCVRCRNMVVTKDDLYRLFSFYWLLVYEREEIGAKRWSKYFAHIIRIIDRDIAPQFDNDFVKTIKAEAQANPHPAWKYRNQLEVVA